MSITNGRNQPLKNGKLPLRYKVKNLFAWVIHKLPVTVLIVMLGYLLWSGIVANSEMLADKFANEFIQTSHAINFLK